MSCARIWWMVSLEPLASELGEGWQHWRGQYYALLGEPLGLRTPPGENMLRPSSKQVSLLLDSAHLAFILISHFLALTQSCFALIFDLARQSDDRILQTLEPLAVASLCGFLDPLVGHLDAINLIPLAALPPARE